LKQRHIETITPSEYCGANEEYIQHALFECTWSRISWQEMSNDVKLKILSFHPNSWVKNMVDNKEIKEEESSMILCGFWVIWRERNARKHGDSIRD
jgi:hypothetical protein